jgi:recombination protein RecR
MSKRIAGPEIERLIQLLAKVPGLGPRSARRATLQLIKKKTQLMGPLALALQTAHDHVMLCAVCGNADTVQPCTICIDESRDSGVIIVVEEVSDLWALERASAILNVRYHVLGGRLSPLDGVGPEDLNIVSLLDRVEQGSVNEIIIAVNATIEGQTTAHYVTDLLRPFNVNITRLAHGVPVGGELDYLDDGTLAAAMRARTQL